MAIGRSGPGWAGPGQQWAWPKLGRAKISPVFLGQDFNSPARPKNRASRAKYSFQGKKKIRTGQVGPGHTGLGHTGPGQIWPGFFQANNLMAQPGPNFGRTGLAHRVGPILTPLPRKVRDKTRTLHVCFVCDHMN